jgi:hypothetical protein
MFGVRRFPFIPQSAELMVGVRRPARESFRSSDSSTLNAQRSTLNAQFTHLNVGRWALDVGRLLYSGE